MDIKNINYELRQEILKEKYIYILNNENEKEFLEWSWN